MCRCAITRIEKEEMPQHSRKDDEQRDAVALIASFRQEDNESMHEIRRGSATEIYLDVAQCMDCPSGLKYQSSIILLILLQE
ncbi:hypothetical protein V6N11_018293 [Hibiscus sabdariffa]|uniref:Uncharacterized protein n=1 Tax=Hibiscus sabdariffa TaxID=183260 RepID=A0ABR2T7G7_9ROSI